MEKLHWTFLFCIKPSCSHSTDHRQAPSEHSPTAGFIRHPPPHNTELGIAYHFKKRLRH